MSNFPVEWDQFRLDEVNDVRMSNVDKKTVEGEKDVRLCNYMDVYNNREITKKITFMKSTAKDNQIQRFLIKKGDVIITKDSETPEDIAVPSYVAEDFDDVLCGYHLALMRPDTKKVLGSYLAQTIQLDYYRNYFFKLASGSTRFGLTIQSIHDVKLHLPEIKEQKKIAEILTSVDKVIELTEVEIEKLKNLKKGMMQDLLTKGIGHTNFKDSPIGKIPENWKLLKIENLGSDVKSTVKAGPFGSKIKKEFYVKTGYKVYGQEQVIKGDFRHGDYYIDEEHYQNLKSCSVEVGDLLMSLVGTVGKTLIIPKEAEKGVINPRLLRIRVNHKTCSVNFLEYYLQSPIVKDLLDSQSQGGTMDVLNATTLKGIYIGLPSFAEQNRIVKVLSSIDTRLNGLCEKLFKTKNLKKGLMQDLLTGKVRVKI